MTLIEKVKAAIADPSLFTNELIAEAMGDHFHDWQPVLRFRWRDFAIHFLGECNCGDILYFDINARMLQEVMTYWHPDMNMHRDEQPSIFEVMDKMRGKPRPYLTDWNIIMPEAIKRYITPSPRLDDLGGAIGWLAGKHYDLNPASALWAAIMADMIEKGEIK